LAMEGLSDGGAREDRAVLDAALDEALAAFRGARAVIVDVSYNLGGYEGVAQHAAARFADARRLACTKVPHGAQNVEPQSFYVEPSKRARYLGPVYLLTSDITVSAGESFALYMRALPNVVHIGGTTRGALSDQIEKPLPNGWSLVLSTEIYRDPDGQWYEVRGIPPQLQREVFPPDDLTSGHARAVLALMDEIIRKK
jgi:carboxyl-terminal processing protease